VATPLTAYLPDVLPHVAMCPSVVATHELLRAAQDFFERSRVWKAMTAPVAVAASQSLVDVVSPAANTDPARIEAAWLDGRRLYPKTVEELNDVAGPLWTTQAGATAHYVQMTPYQVQLYPLPSVAAAQGIIFNFAVMPGEGTTTLPDDVADRYRDQIIMGAKARLMLYQNKPWSNPGMGGALMAQFEADVARFNASASVRGLSNARRAARIPWC
jgi:hypothetical protein